MDCRTSLLAALTFSLGCGGCVLTQTATNPTTPPAEAPVVTKSESEQACGMMLALAQLKEKQANDAAQTPDLQAKLRDEARQSYKDVVRIDPNSLAAYRGLGRICTQSGNYDQALDLYRKALQRFPKSPELWFDLGQCYNRRKDWPEAIKAFEEARKYEPENRQLLTTLGLTLARAGQAEQGLEYLSQAGGTALAHYNLARMHAHLGQMEQARTHLTLALRENPNLQGARELLVSLDFTPATAVRAEAPASN